MIIMINEMLVGTLRITTTSSGIYPTGELNLLTFLSPMWTTSMQYSLGKSCYV